MAEEPTRRKHRSGWQEPEEQKDPVSRLYEMECMESLQEMSLYFLLIICLSSLFISWICLLWLPLLTFSNYSTHCSCCRGSPLWSSKSYCSTWPGSAWERWIRSCSRSTTCLTPGTRDSCVYSAPSMTSHSTAASIVQTEWYSTWSVQSILLYYFSILFSILFFFTILLYYSSNIH